MSNKTKNILKLTPSVVIALAITVSAASKFSGLPALVQSFTERGLIQYLNVFATMELLFVALFLNPRTMKIGLLLLTAYFGGAIATELSYRNAMIAPAVILSMLWVAAYLRNPGIFTEKRQSAIGPGVSAIS